MLRRPDGPLTDTVEAERAVTARDLLTFTWGFGMQGAMFMAAEPWPIVSAVEERELGSFGPPQPAATLEPDTWMARLGELPLLAQPGERWLYSAGSQVLGVLAARAAGAPFEDVMRERVLAPLGMDDTAFYADGHRQAGHRVRAARRGTGGQRPAGRAVVTPAAVPRRGRRAGVHGRAICSVRPDAAAARR